ncbi:MAG: hypothetical protein AAFV53_11395 [Myxococcota bacterium]
MVDQPLIIDLWTVSALVLIVAFLRHHLPRWRPDRDPQRLTPSSAPKPTPPPHQSVGPS